MILRNSCENKCVGNYCSPLSGAGGEEGGGGGRVELGVIKDELIQGCLSGGVCCCNWINVSARAAVSEAQTMIAIYRCFQLSRRVRVVFNLCRKHFISSDV